MYYRHDELANRDSTNFFLFLPTQIFSHKIKIMCVMKFYFYFYFDRPTHFFKIESVNHVIKNNWPILRYNIIVYYVYRTIQQYRSIQQLVGLNKGSVTVSHVFTIICVAGNCSNCKIYHNKKIPSCLMR